MDTTIKEEIRNDYNEEEDTEEEEEEEAEGLIQSTDKITRLSKVFFNDTPCGKSMILLLYWLVIIASVVIISIALFAVHFVVLPLLFKGYDRSAIILYSLLFSVIEIGIVGIIVYTYIVCNKRKQMMKETFVTMYKEYVILQ